MQLSSCSESYSWMSATWQGMYSVRTVVRPCSQSRGSECGWSAGWAVWLQDQEPKGQRRPSWLRIEHSGAARQCERQEVKESAAAKAPDTVASTIFPQAEDKAIEEADAGAALRLQQGAAENRGGFMRPSCASGSAISTGLLLQLTLLHRKPRLRNFGWWCPQHVVVVRVGWLPCASMLDSYYAHIWTQLLAVDYQVNETSRRATHSSRAHSTFARASWASTAAGTWASWRVAAFPTVEGETFG